MRGIVGLYLGVGIALLAIAFLMPKQCLHRNASLVSNAVFVLTWPVGLYDQVYHGPLSARGWLAEQACGGGKLGGRRALSQEPADTPLPPPGGTLSNQTR